MSDSGRNNFGRPDAMVEAGYQLFKYCGGSGGGDCTDVTGATGVVLEYRVQKYIVFNRRIVFQNKDVFGVRLFNDAGPAGLCSHSVGATEYPFYMALSANGVLTDAEVVARGKLLSGALPYDIEFVGDEIPQPADLLWNTSIFVHLYWGDATYVNQNGALPDNNAFRIVKHDYDVRL